MGAVSYKSDNLFYLKQTISYGKKACESSKTENYARFAFLFSSAAEAIKCAECTVKALGSIPFCIIKIPFSLYYLVYSPDNGIAKYIHHSFPGIKDVVKHAILAGFCYVNIKAAPVIGFISPDLNIWYHNKLFEYFEVKPYK